MELQILDAIQKLHTSFLDALMVAVTTLGNGGWIWIVWTACFLIRKQTRRAGLVMAAALCLDFLLCNLLIKPFVARTRPFDVNTAVQLLISRPADYSFPSGHTAAAFAVTAALWFSGKRKMFRLALALAVLIAFSRLYLYVHYPTDVLGGAALGIICGFAASKIVKLQLKQYKYVDTDSGREVK